jgi:hypothetical protein
MTDEPDPPSSLPQYLAEGLPRQDTATLRATKEYIEALLDTRDQSVSPAELPAAAEPVDRADGRPGTVVRERVQCGDDTCGCTSGEPADLHGPYLYRYYRRNGELTSEYLGKP